jgi:hypothetical protein
MMRLFASTSPLLKLVRRGKWDAVEEMLLEEKDGSVIRDACPTFLHQLLKHNPPVGIVDIVLLRLQASDTIVEEERDEKDKTPLHVAAIYSCDSRIIQLLLSGVSGTMPARMTDKAGNTPLHVACSVNFDAFRKQNKAKTLAEMNNATEIVTRLLRAYPEAATLTNKEGATPLDLATRHNGDARIINRLEFVQEAFAKGDQIISSEAFKIPLSSNEFSIVSRSVDDLNASFSSVGFDNEFDEGIEGSLPDQAEVRLSAVPEEGKSGA